MEYYFKKTWCGMVLMVLHKWEDDGKGMQRYIKATEQQTQQFIKELNEKDLHR